MSKYVLDTSFITALINESDVHYLNAKYIFSQTKPNSKFIVTSSVLMELAVIGKRIDGISGNLQVEFATKLATDVIEIDKKTIIRIADFSDSISEFGLKASPVDMSLLFYSHTQNAKLVSFDKRLNVTSKKLAQLAL